jgi:hypothetical protein
MSRRQALGGPLEGFLFEATISTNQQELNLATWAAGQGWNGTDNAQITIASGVYVWSNSVSTPALTTGSFPNGLTLIVNGYVMGKGGKGGGSSSAAGESGGPAISLGTDITIVGGTNGYIGGGGGGGGAHITGSFDLEGGGGAGGGVGGESADAGSGGSIGQSGANGSDSGGTGDAGDGGTAGGGGAGDEDG